MSIYTQFIRYVYSCQVSAHSYGTPSGERLCWVLSSVHPESGYGLLPCDHAFPDIIFSVFKFLEKVLGKGYCLTISYVLNGTNKLHVLLNWNSLPWILAFFVSSMCKITQELNKAVHSIRLEPAHSFRSSSPGLANRSAQVGKSWPRVWTKIWEVQRYEGNLRFPCLACSLMSLFLLFSRPLPNHRPLLKILILSGLQDSFPYSPFRKSSTNPEFLLLPTDCLDRWGRVRTAVQTSIHAAKGCDFLFHMSHWCAVLLNWIKSFSRYSHLLGGRCERLGRLFSFPNASRNQRFLFFSVLRTEPRARNMLGKSSGPTPHPPSSAILNNANI